MCIIFSSVNVYVCRFIVAISSHQKGYTSFITTSDSDVAEF